jgi:hypothetical protein
VSYFDISVTYGHSSLLFVVSDGSHPYFLKFKIIRLTKELVEANKKMKDDSVESDKKTFLKAQMPKMETEITSLKKHISELLDEDELDPRGEFFILAKKLTA